jgi:aldehyde dehydrogenase (NAD+)
MRIFREEVFGPVLAVTLFDDMDEAVGIANDSAYGLAAGVWTSDIRRAHGMARRLKSGTVYVNAYRAVSVGAPVGGYKCSGFGRENGIEAMNEFTQTKSVWINIGEGMANPLAAPAA